jgi:predicted secreted hydrolase
MYRNLLPLLLAAIYQPAFAAPPYYPAITADAPALAFPRDHAAHPAYRTEWWYLTGWLKDSGGDPIGFQVTFFRSRPAVDQDNPSAFAAKQVVMAHAALSDPRRGRLIHDQRVSRLGFGRAAASDSTLDLTLDDWRWQGNADGGFVIQVPARGFTLTLSAAPTQTILVEGPNGVSAKGGEAASRYYSEPHMAITAQLDGRTLTGEAWFDHEWSSTLLPDGAVGWDWAALDLDDGASLMAFRIRDAGGKTLWTGGTWRDSGRSREGPPLFLGDDAVQFTPRRRWHSPQSGADYPVETDLAVTLGGEKRLFTLRPLLDDQELDSRLAGGPIYWEGAVSCEQGRGYLELTGYDRPFGSGPK